MKERRSWRESGPWSGRSLRGCPAGNGRSDRMKKSNYREFQTMKTTARMGLLWSDNLMEYDAHAKSLITVLDWHQIKMNITQ